MKAELIKSEFKPVEIKVTFEKRKEFEAFYALLSRTTAQQRFDITYMDKNCALNTDLTPQDFISMEEICNALQEVN